MTTLNYLPTAPEDWCSPCQMGGHNACVARSGGVCVCSCTAQTAAPREAFGADFVLSPDSCPACVTGRHAGCTGDCACGCSIPVRPPAGHFAA